MSVAVNQARDLMRKRRRVAEIELVADRGRDNGGGIDPATGIDARGLMTFTRSFTDHFLSEGVMEVAEEAFRLTNDEGAWTGSGRLTLVASGGPPSQVAALRTLEGEGAYEGLTLELHGEEPDDSGEVWWGVIYPTAGDPPAPEAIAAE